MLVLFLIVGLGARLFNFLLLLFDQETLHRVIVIVIPDQKRKLPLLWQHWSFLFLVLAALILRHLLSLLSHDILPSNFELFRVFIIACLVSRMVNTEQAPSNLCASQVINSQVCAALVLILEPPETL